MAREICKMLKTDCYLTIDTCNLFSIDLILTLKEYNDCNIKFKFLTSYAAFVNSERKAVER